MGRDDNRKRAECGRRTQHCADVLGIAQLIQDDDDARSRCRASAQHTIQVGFGERIDFQRQPLMDGVAWQDRRQTALIEHRYRRSGPVIAPPKGLHQSEPLPEPIFTPATKEEKGHDINIPFEQMAKITGREVAETLRQRSLDVYRRAADYARGRGILLADTKFEWGRVPEGELILIDEVLTPDSSRFWPADDYRVGVSPPSFDKQFVRDWLETTTLGQEQSAAAVARRGRREDAAEISRSVSALDRERTADILSGVPIALPTVEELFQRVIADHAVC